MWPFRKKLSTPSEQWPPINENWRAGDLAQCIDGDWPNTRLVGPRKGQITIVADLSKGRLALSGIPAWGLILEGFPEAWDESQFRKLRPCGDALDRRAKKARRKEKERTA